MSKTRNEDWIRDATRDYMRMATAPIGPSGYPPVIESGALLELVRDKSRINGLPPELVYAVIEQESRFANNAVSPKGAAGLMQLMPATQTTFGVTNPFDPERNVATGTKFLRAMRGIIPANDADYGSVRQLVEKLGLDALAEDE